MTSTSSAAATGLPDRRHFLSTVALVGAATVPAFPALADAPGPIEAMYDKYLRLEAALDDAYAVEREAEQEYVEPERPRWLPFKNIGSSRTLISGGRRYCVLDDRDENIAFLRSLIAKERWPDNEEHVLWQHAAHARDAKLTLAEIEAWKAEVARRKDAAGLTQAEAAAKAAFAERRKHCDAMLDIEATSYRELACQAAILSVDWDQGHAERLLDRLTALAGVLPHVVA